MTGLAEVAMVVTGVGCGLVGGVFFAFSTFVMGALRRLPPAQGIAAMQSINVLAVTPAFMTALFGTALACVALSVLALTSPGDWPVTEVLASSALYLIATIGVTIGRHVPMNNTLATWRADDTDAASYWHDYVARWTAWNHVRTVAALAAAATLTVALTV